MLSDFSQDIVLNKGNNSIKITYRSGITELRYIELQEYLETAIAQPKTDNPLRAWTSNGLLHVTGLTVGKMMSIYNTSGALVFGKIVGSKEIEIPLSAQGVYIIKSGENLVNLVIGN